jgi:fibronectin type 3 domain-containing protein
MASTYNRIVFIILLLISFSIEAREVILTWEANSEPDLSHYIVYWGNSSGNYPENSGNIGLVTEYSVTIPDEGQYFFVVTAVNEAGLESDFSNEVATEYFRYFSKFKVQLNNSQKIKIETNGRRIVSQ